MGWHEVGLKLEGQVRGVMHWGGTRWVWGWRGK